MSEFRAPDCTALTCLVCYRSMNSSGD